MKFIKVVSALLIVVLMLSVLASCGNKEIVGIVDQANDNLSSKAVSITTKVTLECDKKLVKEYMNVSDSIIKIYKDGNNTCVSSMLNKKPVSYTFVNDKVYVDSAASKCYANLSASQFNNYSDKLDVSDTMLDISIFKSVEMKSNEDGTKNIVCKGIDQRDQRMLNRILLEFNKKTSVQYTIDFESVEYNVTLNKDGFFVSAKTVIPIWVNYYGVERVQAFINSSSLFDYVNAKAVEAPENTGDYVKVDANDLFE